MPVVRKRPGRNVLIVAFHFPPQAGGSGLLRSLKFCRYLPEFGWSPTVLTVHPRAYEQKNERQLELVPSNLHVIRAFCLDTRRHLAIRGRYLRLLALPDSWVSWAVGAIPAGLGAIRRERVDVIFATFPVATAVFIGLILHRLTGKPWVVDFRDSMTEEGYPRDPLSWRIWRWLERKAVQHAARLIFTAESTIRMYLQRYPNLSREKCVLIPNGYDEEDFENLPTVASAGRDRGRALHLLHSGLVYPEERDPRPLFRAVARLKQSGQIAAQNISIDFRAPGFEAIYAEQIESLGIGDVVHLLPRVSYHEAVREYVAADGLLLLQAACCDHQIPAKAYEYLRLGKPILALTTQTGDTARLLKEVGGATIVDAADEDAIRAGLPEFVRAVRCGAHPLPNIDRARRYSRRNQAKELAAQLSQLLDFSPSGAVQKAPLRTS